MTVLTADLRLVCLGLVVPLASVALILASYRLLQANRSQRRRPAFCLALALLLLGASFVGIARLNGSKALRVIVGVEILLTGLYVLYVAAGSRPTESRGQRTPGAKWLMGMALLAVVGLPVFAALASEKQTTPDRTPLVHVTTKAISGFGPPRPVFRCTKPMSCEGPKYVVFNSYVNNAKAGDERPFLSVRNPYGRQHRVVDSLFLDGKPRLLMLRAFIDNNTYQHLPGVQTTDAMDTRLRLVLPSHPTYETTPTAYLYAGNARPKMIWDTISLYSVHRPVRLTYVPGSTSLYRKSKDGRDITEPLADGVVSTHGLSLGRWKADFRYSGYVDFQVRVTPLPEPVRNPQDTRGFGSQVVYLPPVKRGLAKEPLPDGDSVVGDRFSCTQTRCKGPPFPELNAYQNHPLLGDEADFVRGTLVGDYRNEGVELYHTVAVVRPGDQLKVRIAIDNGGDPTAISALPLNQLVARDMRARVLLPTGSGRELFVSAYLDSANTRPREISDLLPVRSQQMIRLRLRPRTAGILSADGLRLAPHTLFAKSDVPPSRRQRWGVTIGNIPPSFSKVVYVMFYLEVLATRR